MYRFGRGRWSIALLDDWVGEFEGGTACISRPGGNGVLLISSADKDEGPVEPGDLRALARGECPQHADVGDCELGAFRGIHAMYADDGQGARWHRWYLGYGSAVLLVTYMVPLELEGAEDEAVMAMLRSLRGRGDAWK
ncbi:MAG: hypothetical protein OEZ06_22555 [Myxococcales bacterium]|nr:hypothetical protein [Myxococcales bacterium]